MVSNYAGMKSALLMRSYIGLGPLVLALSSVRLQSKTFKNAYDDLQEREGQMFPYMRLMGRGHELNRNSYPDLYYCAMTHYTEQGALGSSGRFVRSDVTPTISKLTLEKYAKLSAAGMTVSAESIQAWREGAQGVGVELQEAEVQSQLTNYFTTSDRLKKFFPKS